MTRFFPGVWTCTSSTLAIPRLTINPLWKEQTWLTKQEAIVINHRDFSILPPKADQRDLNFIQSTLAGSSSKRPFAHTGFTLPERAVPKRHSAALDYFPPQSGSVYTMATHIMRPPRHLRGLVPEVLQTTNPVVPISPDSILSIARLER